MEQYDSSVEESSKVSEQQQRNDEQQCPSYAAELTETSVWMIAASETDCKRADQISEVAWLLTLSRIIRKQTNNKVSFVEFILDGTVDNSLSLVASTRLLSHTRL